MKRFSLIALFLIIMLISMPLVSADIADLEGKSRNYTYKERGNYETYDGSVSGSYQFEVEIEVEFFDESDGDVLSVIVTTESDGGSSGSYRDGGFDIFESSIEYKETDFEQVSFADFDSDLFVVNFPFVVADTGEYISNLADSYDENPDIEITDEDTNSISAVIERELNDSSLLPESKRDEILDETIEISVSFDDDGLIQSFAISRMVEFGDITIIEETEDLRSGFFRIVNNIFTSVLFYVILFVAIAAAAVWYFRFRNPY